MTSAPLEPGQNEPPAVLYRAPEVTYPLAVAASGVSITDSTGKRYLDMSGGAAVSCLGHGHPDVIAAIREQLETLAYAHTRFFTNEPQELLASALATRFDATGATGASGARVYFTSGGSEANETALKMAWQYWVARGRPEKKIVISREQSYHGNTFGVLSVSGNSGRRRASGAPLLDWPRIPPCYEYRERGSGESIEAYAERAAAYLEEAIIACGSDQVAAFICEPVVGSSLGVVPAVPAYLARIREICDRHEVLLIADEVMCGSGRTGTYFAHEHDGVVPDMVTLAKGLGGGYQPLAATILSAAIAETLTHAGFTHGHTYVGHPTACAAGVAVQRVLERDDLLTRTGMLGRKLLALLEEAFAGHPQVGDVRGRGLFAAVELVSDRETRAGFENRASLPEELCTAAMAQGLICYPGGLMLEGRMVPHVLLAPPMIATEQELGEGVEKLVSTLDAVFGRVR